MDEIADVVEGLPDNTGRSDMDIYRDFRALFLGSDLGKRVLRDIMAMGRFYTTTSSTEQYRTYILSGRRDLVIDIIRKMTFEPHTPTEATRREQI